MIHPMEAVIEQRHPGALDRICETITDLLYGGTCPVAEEQDGYVHIADKVSLNACNCAITGTFWLGGIEYSFEAESGDWNGWVWRELAEDAPVPEIDHTPTVWALEPNQRLVTEAIANGKAAILLEKWDALSTREPYASLPRNYAYDRHFQPGVQIERHYREQADKAGFVLRPEEDVKATRDRLAAHACG